jgi:hypothetical protein
MLTQHPVSYQAYRVFSFLQMLPRIDLGNRADLSFARAEFLPVGCHVLDLMLEICVHVSRHCIKKIKSRYE